MAGAGGFTALARDLADLFGRGVDAPLDDASFQEWALRNFRFQFQGNTTYRGFCEGRGVTAGSVERWQDVPAVPTSAFKVVDLGCASAGEPEADFLTSGTTGGKELKGRHPVASLELYRASSLPTLKAYLVPEDRPLPLLSLIPPREETPHSSLSTMLGFIAERWGDPVRWLAGGGGIPDVDAFLQAGGEAEEAGRAVLVAGTAFAFVHLLDGLETRGARVALPPGSRILETGGFKGRSREVARDELYASLQVALGVPVSRMVNEYGMTELLSQLYEPVLADEAMAGAELSERRHVPPPWVRVRALDPDTLDELPAGTPGLLALFDLANLGSVSHVLTQDLGFVDDRGVRVLGRAFGAEPRGCSLAVEDLLAAREDTR